MIIEVLNAGCDRVAAAAARRALARLYATVR